ncbi:glutamine amidotransferase [Paeniglutamicibacter cryotolerans]|uniref:GMP synthase (Glutamine-hydrolyzing) n=1 Tax=Paeniglutamicibacter cryotolerans TaxID=670079 RepID=A0A839QHB1_9MICC|nr:glutamine amidotransferase [Paeniglutamicibacter cryotolerans]MBB2995280.1 GMP synthase (glutamine-hydrolyzing) [Paeniglutamicibacter cryotolerans]
MKPFLLISTRSDAFTAEDEVRGVLQASGLDPTDLHTFPLESETLGPVDADWVRTYSGIILGGSPFNASDPPERKSSVQVRCEADLHRLLDVLVELDFPFFGACYGVGTLGSHQGAVIDRNFGEPVGTSRIVVTDAGRADPMLRGLPDSFDAFVGHKEAVRTLPAHAVLLASSAPCPVQMFRIKENLYATQFHPELDPAGLAGRIMTYKDAGYFPPERALELRERALAAEVDAPGLVLANFVRRYGNG